MKFLFLLNPLKSRSRKLRNGALLKAVREGRKGRRFGAAFEIKVGAPGAETRQHAEEMLDGHDKVCVPVLEEERRYLEAAERLRGRTPERISRRVEYSRGEGPAAEALIEWLGRIHSEVFDFDALVSTLPAPLLDRAAAAVGAISVRTDLWPGIWGRWRYTSIVRCRNANGIDPLENLCLSDLRNLGLHEVPASVDQRLQGTQPQVNPFECRFAPLDESLSRAFHSDCRTALIVPQTPSDAVSTGGNAFPHSRAFLDAVLPPLLDAGWRCLIIGETDTGRRLAGAWADREGVFLIDEANEYEIKEERRKILALLAQVHLLVTDNSPTALEAMMYERPVCVLGRPFFALQGVTPGLGAVVSGDFDEAAYRDAASLVRAFFLRAYGTPFFGPGSARRLFDRIQAVAQLTRRFGDQPEAWARAIERKFGKPGQAGWLQQMREVHARLERFGED